MTHHDFSWWYHIYPQESSPNQELCVYCHTPYNAQTDADSMAAPLWNHTVTQAGYEVYSSSTMNADVFTPDGLSKLCLSCHDGTIAIDSHSNRSGSVFLGPPGSGFGHEGGLIGTKLSNDQPISFVYNDTLANEDGKLRLPSITPSGLPGGGTIASDMLTNGRVECTTCHDVHVPRYDSSSNCHGCHVVNGQWYSKPTTLSLRKSNSGSSLCLTCHVK